MNWCKLSLICLMALAVGCGNDNDEIVAERSPLKVVFSVPSAEVLPSPYDEPSNLSATFNRATGLDEMQMSIFPPVVAGNITTNPDSRRTWTWNAVQFEAAQGAYFWLIDGVNLGFWVNLADERVFLREPVVVRIPSTYDRQPAVGFAGIVQSPNANVLASGTLVFALPADSGFNPLDPAGTFDPALASCIAVALSGGDLPEGNADYRATLLPEDTLYVVVAVKDTNDDLYYSPADDWWGYYQDGDVDSVWSRLDTGDKDNPFNFGVDINLRAPVGAPGAD